MLQLNPETFSRAIKKAQSVKPSVKRVVGSGYVVPSGDGVTMHTVRFTAMRGSLWASCSCRAGVGFGGTAPMPCYHVAAVLISAPHLRHVKKGNDDFEAWIKAGGEAA